MPRGPFGGYIDISVPQEKRPSIEHNKDECPSLLGAPEQGLPKIDSCCLITFSLPSRNIPILHVLPVSDGW